MSLRDNGCFDPATDAPRISTPGNPWIEETDMMDAVALILSGHAKRCKSCRRPCRHKHLKEGECPDCREISNAADATDG